MGLFNFKKKGKVIDLTERYRKQQERTERIKEDMQQESPVSQPQENSGGMFGIFGGATPVANQQITNESPAVSPVNIEERKRKLTNRLMNMTSKIEELSNQIYHLQQRIEVLEKRVGVREVG